MKSYLLLLCFSLPLYSQNIEFPSDFEFGVSNASTQVEDSLSDAWMQFAREGKVASFKNQANPEMKLLFWSQPEVEIEWAKKLGVKTFRMSLDWQRLVPNKPFITGKVQNLKALEHYRKILRKIKAAGMKPMVTLFHHSLPDWAIADGGWTNSATKNHFVDFAYDVISKLNQEVHSWNTFNEPNVYAMFSYVAGIWPPGKSNLLGVLNFPFYKGDFFKAIENMAEAHNLLYKKAKKDLPSLSMGIAHNTAYYTEGSWLSMPAVDWSWKNMNYLFPDLVKENLDFLGVNYYGSEYMTLSGIHFDSRAEYNDAGRAFYPDGLFRILKDFYERYKLPLWITENGTADQKNFFKSSYIIEHLMAVNKAIQKGVPVKGYILWTLTDNFEWADGYCPKFGLIEVDRVTMNRTPRESYYLYQEIIKERKITHQQQNTAWESVKQNFGKERPMCRAIDAEGSLETPRKLNFKKVDWRFSL